jgi:hypothetical protein
MESYWGEISKLAIWNGRSINNWSKEARALFESQTLEAASNGVDQTQACSLQCELRCDLEIMYIVRNIFSEHQALARCTCKFCSAR